MEADPVGVQRRSVSHFKAQTSSKLEPTAYRARQHFYFLHEKGHFIREKGQSQCAQNESNKVVSPREEIATV